MKVIPLNSELVEDDDQYEIDVVFGSFLLFYTIYLSTIHEDVQSVGKFNIVFSNLFSFFPIYQAQGLFLKSVLLCTLYYSLCYHYVEIGNTLPHSIEYYKLMDVVFSTCIIFAFAISWFPDCLEYQPTKEQLKRSCWYRNFLGKPQDTAEWKLRFTVKNVIIMLSTLMLSIIVYNYDSFGLRLAVAIGSIVLAFLLSFLQLYLKQISVSKKNRIKFMCWVFFGCFLGIIGFVYKMNSFTELYGYIHHSVWHSYVFSCAYCFSRAAEYISKVKTKINEKEITGNIS